MQSFKILDLQLVCSKNRLYMRKKKRNFFPLSSPTSLILGAMTVVAWGP